MVGHCRLIFYGKLHVGHSLRALANLALHGNAAD